MLNKWGEGEIRAEEFKTQKLKLNLLQSKETFLTIELRIFLLERSLLKHGSMWAPMHLGGFAVCNLSKPGKQLSRLIEKFLV